jgi:hypothetical protein
MAFELRFRLLVDLFVDATGVFAALELRDLTE